MRYAESKTNCSLHIEPNTPIRAYNIIKLILDHHLNIGATFKQLSRRGRDVRQIELNNMIKLMLDHHPNIRTIFKQLSRRGRDVRQIELNDMTTWVTFVETYNEL